MGFVKKNEEDDILAIEPSYVWPWAMAQDRAQLVKVFDS